MIDTRNATLNQGPEALDAIGIDIVGSANFGAVVNAKMPISKPLHSVIGREFVCIEGSSRSYMLRHKRNKSGTIHIGNDFGGYFAIPLGCTDNFRFVLCTSPTLACSFTTDIRFVNFHLTLQVLEIFIKEGSYLLTHSPSRLIGNACFTLDLLGRDTTPGRSHSVHNLKPSPEWGSRLMEDSPRSRGNEITTVITAITRSTLYLVMLGYFLALNTVDTVSPSVLFQPLKASVIIGEFLFKIVGCVFLHCPILPTSKAYHK